MTSFGVVRAVSLLLVLGFLAGACARLPYTTRVIHDSPRVRVVLQHEVKPAHYSHPARVTVEQIGRLLAGLSIREQRSVPLRWFSEDVPPKPLFREDERHALAPLIAAALEQAGPEERVAFRLYAPGPNPNYDRETTSGWVAFRDPYIHVGVDYFHTLLPVRKIDQYDYNFPLTEKDPATYLLYFEPGRFWVVDPGTGRRAVDFRALEKSGVPTEPALRGR